MVLGLSLGLSGCGGESGNKQLSLGEAKVTTPAISTEGVLKVGVSSNKTPFSGMSQNGIIGLDVDIAAAIADLLGLRLQLVDIVGMDNATIGEMFINGELDLVMSYQTDDRSSSPFSTVGPYLMDGPAVFTASNKLTSGDFDADNVFGLLGYRIATQAGTLSSWIIENRYGSDILDQYPNIEDAFRSVNDGTVDYAAADIIIGAFLCRSNYPDIQCVAYLQRSEGVFVAIAPGNQELTQACKDALTTLRDNGVLQLLIRKWLGQPATELVFDPIAIVSADSQVVPDGGEGLPDPENSDINPNPGDEGF